MTDFYFKPAGIEDCELLYDWAIDSETRNNSINTEIFSYNSHKKWFTNKLKDENYQFLIFCSNQQKIGLIRLEKNGSNYILSYLISPEYRGKGYAKKMLLQMEEYIINNIGNCILEAVVKENNIISNKVLISLKYNLINKFDGLNAYMKTVGEK